MRRLSGVGARFLAAEAATAHGHHASPAVPAPALSASAGAPA